MKTFLVTQSFIVQGEDYKQVVRRLIAYESDIAYRQVQKGHADGIFAGAPEVQQIVDSVQEIPGTTTIPPKISAEVAKHVLRDLQAYLEEAEEAEDDVTLKDPDVEKRVRDFYRYKKPD